MKTPVNVNLTVHPQAADLRRRSRELQSGIASLIVERDQLKHSTVPQIFAEYQVKVGALELRVFEFECEIRAMIRRIELAQAALNRGKKPSYKNIEAEIKTEFAAWREKIAQQMQAIKEAKALQEMPVMSAAESRELQNTYRRLAFLLHPDIIGSADERRQKFWLQAADAYRYGDLQTLRTILLLVETDAPENGASDKSAGILETLKMRHAELKALCEKMLDEIAEIKATAPYILHKILDDKLQLEKVQNDLNDQIEQLRYKRRQLISHWAEIMRFAEDKQDVEIPAEPADIFNDDNDWAKIIYEF